MSLKESISDLSKSVRAINEKMQAENRTLDEIERLSKLRERADHKLRKLRRQDARQEFCSD